MYESPLFGSNHTSVFDTLAFPSKVCANASRSRDRGPWRPYPFSFNSVSACLVNALDKSISNSLGRFGIGRILFCLATLPFNSSNAVLLCLDTVLEVNAMPIKAATVSTPAPIDSHSKKCNKLK